MAGEEITREYNLRMPRFEQLRAEVLFILDRELKASGIKLHSVTSRLKTPESFVAKVARKNAANPFEIIRDLVGVRIVCLFLTDIPGVGDIIRNSFQVIAEDNKIAGGEVSSFGYMSVHFDVTMKTTYAGPRYDNIIDLPCEIQVRTIAMDAWANVAHHLSYKTDVDVPDELKKDFYALSGLFYVADKHFEMFYGASISARRATVEALEASTDAEIAEQPLNADTLAAFLARQYPEREHSSAADISDLLAELLDGGISTLGQPAELLEATEQAFMKYESERPPSGGKFTEVGVARISAHIFDKRMHKAGYARIFPKHPEAQFERSDQGFQPYRKLVKRGRHKAG